MLGRSRRTLRGRYLIAGVVGLTALLAIPATAPAKPSTPPGPPQDTATATGQNLIVDDFGSVDIVIDVHSGPSGENPDGHVSFVAGQILPISGPITCLDVSGNTAVMTVSPTGSRNDFALVRLVDNGGSGLDRFEYVFGPPIIQVTNDCHADLPQFFGGLLIGRAVVGDVDPPPPFPTSKQQCKRGGYADFGFSSQGRCIRYVNHHSPEST